MISEHEFSVAFAGFWEELLPLLTPSFVHMINESLEQEVRDANGFPVPGVPRDIEGGESALVAELAFFLARASVERNMDVDSAFTDSSVLAWAERRAEASVEAHRGSGQLSLTVKDKDEALALARNYAHFFRQRTALKEIRFMPVIPGAGFLASCQADISLGETLFEVKTVTRKVAGKDIRQLVIYLALQAATGRRLWLRGGFFNPRRAVWHEFNVDEMVSRMSGGKAALEVFRELIAFVGSWEIPMDRAF